MAESAVDQKGPHVAERDVMVDQVLDVDAAVPKCPAVLVGFRDLGGEGDDAFESLDEAVGHSSHGPDSCTTARRRHYRSVRKRERRA